MRQLFKKIVILIQNNSFLLLCYRTKNIFNRVFLYKKKNQRNNLFYFKDRYNYEKVFKIFLS